MWCNDWGSPSSPEAMTIPGFKKNAGSCGPEKRKGAALQTFDFQTPKKLQNDTGFVRFLYSGTLWSSL